MSRHSNDNVLSFLENQTNRYNDRIALGMRNKYGWSEFTYGGLGNLSKNIASYLINIHHITAIINSEANISPPYSYIIKHFNTFFNIFKDIVLTFLKTGC